MVLDDEACSACAECLAVALKQRRGPCARDCFQHGSESHSRTIRLVTNTSIPGGAHAEDAKDISVQIADGDDLLTARLRSGRGENALHIQVGKPLGSGWRK